jgi:hypothetical protein
MPNFVKIGKTVQGLKEERKTNVSTDTKANTHVRGSPLLMNGKLIKNHYYVI